MIRSENMKLKKNSYFYSLVVSQNCHLRYFSLLHLHLKLLCISSQTLSFSWWTDWERFQLHQHCFFWERHFGTYQSQSLLYWEASISRSRDLEVVEAVILMWNALFSISEKFTLQWLNYKPCKDFRLHMVSQVSMIPPVLSVLLPKETRMK